MTRPRPEALPKLTAGTNMTASLHIKETVSKSVRRVINGSAEFRLRRTPVGAVEVYVDGNEREKSPDAVFYKAFEAKQIQDSGYEYVDDEFTEE